MKFSSEQRLIYETTVSDDGFKLEITRIVGQDKVGLIFEKLDYQQRKDAFLHTAITKDSLQELVETLDIVLRDWENEG